MNQLLHVGDHKKVYIMAVEEAEILNPSMNQINPNPGMVIHNEEGTHKPRAPP